MPCTPIISLFLRQRLQDWIQPYLVVLWTSPCIMFTQALIVKKITLFPAQPGILCHLSLPLRGKKPESSWCLCRHFLHISIKLLICSPGGRGSSLVLLCVQSLHNCYDLCWAIFMHLSFIAHPCTSRIYIFTSSVYGSIFGFERECTSRHLL